MGMRKRDLRYLQKCFQDEDMPKELSEIKMCALGSQVIRSSGLPTRISQEYFTLYGIDSMSIDLNGEHGSLQYDLAKQITDPKLIDTFHVLTNYGTSEHVNNQYYCFHNMHHLCRKNAIIVHAVPWIESSRYNTKYYRYSFVFFRNLAKQCHYKIMKEELSRKELVEVTMKKMEDNPFISERLFSQCGMLDHDHHHVCTDCGAKFIHGKKKCPCP